MGKKLKLDLHTHCFEAMGVANPAIESLRTIVGVVKAKGLDGLAITEHNDPHLGWEAKRIVDEHLKGAIIIIPGQEIEIFGRHIVELYLSPDLTFRFLAHPGYGNEGIEIDEDIGGIELENQVHNFRINKKWVGEMAGRYNLVLLRNSDAHRLEDIGFYYNEIDLEDLYLRS